MVAGRRAGTAGRPDPHSRSHAGTAFPVRGLDEQTIAGNFGNATRLLATDLGTRAQSAARSAHPPGYSRLLCVLLAQLWHPTRVCYSPSPLGERHRVALV